MAFDPLLPVNNSEIEAPELRGQFTGLYDLIQAVPVGPAGPQGIQGPAGNGVVGAVVDGVTTGNPGDPATAGASFDGATVHFTFAIPRGDLGTTGPTGAIGPVGPPFTSFVIDSVTSLDPALPATVTAVFDGTNVKLAFGIPRGQQGAEGPIGGTGATGATGPAFTSFVVDSVTTLPPGNLATVTTVFDGTSVRFSFGIPQGPQGNNGFDGPIGATGPQGPAFTSFAVETVNTLPAGQPATVATSFDGTTVRFTFGIPQGPEGPQGIQGPAGPSDLAGTSNNSNGVSQLALAVSDPPTQAQIQAIANKLDELIAALRR